MLPRYSQDETEGFTAPTTLIQAGMVQATRLAPNVGLYVQQLVIEFQEPLVPTAWLAAWEGLVRRHEILRTHFRSSTEGRLQMEVLPWFRSPVPCENWTGLSREETDRKGRFIGETVGSNRGVRGRLRPGWIRVERVGHLRLRFGKLSALPSGSWRFGCRRNPRTVRALRQSRVDGLGGDPRRGLGLRPSS